MYQLLSSVALLCLFALPLAAQEEALHGAWEATIADPEVGEVTIRLTFQADGAFEINQVFRGWKEALLADLAEAEAEGVEIPDFEAEIPDFETVSSIGTGSYRVEGDSLWVDIVEFNMRVDDTDTDFVEILTEVVRTLARFAAGFAEVSEEDYPAFEQTFVAEFLAEFDAQEHLLEVSGASYSIEGDTLFITMAIEDGVGVLEFHRIDVASAVAGITWGGLKAAWRP